MVEFEACSREDFQGNCGSHIWLPRERHGQGHAAGGVAPQGDLACHAGSMPWRTCATLRT